MLVERISTAFKKKSELWSGLTMAGKRMRANEELGRVIREKNARVAASPQEVPEAQFEQYMQEAGDADIAFGKQRT